MSAATWVWGMLLPLLLHQSQMLSLQMHRAGAGTFSAARLGAVGQASGAEREKGPRDFI